MKSNTAKIAVIGLCTLMIVAGLAVPAIATEGAVPPVDETGTPFESKDPDFDRGYITINLGVLGDTFGILCDTPDGYVEYNVGVNNDDPLDPTSSPSGSFNASGDAGDAFPDSDVCLGGAVGPWNPPTETGDWHVMAVDWVFNGCESAADRCVAPLELFVPDDGGVADAWGGLDDVGVGGALEHTFNFRVSGLARVQASYETANTDTNQSCIISGDGDPATQDDPFQIAGPGTELDVCETAGNIGYTSNWFSMGFCGEATMPYVAITDAGDGNVPLAPIASNVQIFWDSPAFLLFDCLLDDAVPPGSTIASEYNNAKIAVNGLTCNHDDSDNIPDTVCIFDFPASAAACRGIAATEASFGSDADDDDAAGAAIRVPVAGIVGETGWNYVDGKCDTSAVTNDSWVSGAGTLVEIFTPDLPGPVDDAITTINDVLDTVDACAAFSFDGETCDSHGNPAG